MYRGAWQATVHGVMGVGQDLVIKPPPPSASNYNLNMLQRKCFVVQTSLLTFKSAFLWLFSGQGLG